MSTIDVRTSANVKAIYGDDLSAIRHPESDLYAERNFDRDDTRFPVKIENPLTNSFLGRAIES